MLNVLRGEMSLVGPRPERPHFVRKFADHYPRYPQRHRVTCGVTGWAQIHGLRGDTSIEERILFDDYYIENGLMVLTAAFLRKRGYCCGNGCRHCPYSEAEKRRQLEKKVI